MEVVGRSNGGGDVAADNSVICGVGDDNGDGDGGDWNGSWRCDDVVVSVVVIAVVSLQICRDRRIFFLFFSISNNDTIGCVKLWRVGWETFASYF